MSWGIALQRFGIVSIFYRYSRWVGKALVLTLLFGCDESIRDPQPSASTDADESSIVASTEQPMAGSTASRSAVPVADATESNSKLSADTVADDERISLITSRITSESQTVASAQSVTLTLTLYDAQGTVLTDAEADVVFTALGGTSTGQLSEVVRTDAGTYQVEFTGIVAGTPTTIGATINGKALISTLPTLTVEPGETDPAHSVITVAQNTIQALGTTTIRLTTYDRHGNRRVQGGDTVSLRLIGGTSVGSFGSVVHLGDGSYECSFTGVRAGTAAQLGATINETPISSSATIRVISGTGLAANSLVSVSSATVQSGSSVTMTLRVIKADGDTDYFGMHDVVFARLSGSSTGTISSVTNNFDGTYTAIFTGILAGTPTTVIASIDGVPVTTTLPTITVTPGPVSANRSILTVSQNTLASGNTANVRLITKDEAGNLMTSGGHTVVLSHAGGTSSGVISAATDNRDGTYDAVFTGVIAGSPTSLMATINNTPIGTVSPSLAVLPGVISLSRSYVLVSSATVNAGSSVSVTLVTRDAAGNLLYGDNSIVAFSHSGGSSTGSFSDVMNSNNGTYTATFTGISAGSATTIAATINSNPVTTTLPTITVQAI